MEETFWQIRVLIICAIVFVCAWFDPNLEKIKSDDAWVYKFAYASFLIRAILFIATKILHLWKV